MIFGYYDESGAYDDTTGKLTNMTVGGCIAPLHKWDALCIEWKRVLDAEGLTWFHMAQFEAWKEPFDFKLADGSRDYERHKRLLNYLLDLMLANLEGFFGFGDTVKFNQHAVEISHRTTMEDCIAGAIKHAISDVWEMYQHPINLIFAKQKHFSQSDIANYVKYYDWEISPRVQSLSFSTPQDTCALQAADILAYEIAHCYRADRKERYPFQRLVDGAKQAGIPFSNIWGFRPNRIHFH